MDNIASSHVYTPFYCEENIYKLNQKMLNTDQQPTSEKKAMCQLFVVMITNPLQQIHIRQQKVGDKTNDYTVVWDYHVILVKKTTEQYKIDDKNHIRSSSQVYDFDTNLGFCSDFEDYFLKALKNPPLQTWFRIVPGNKFQDNFASDRSHMINKTLKNGTILYRKKTPDYDCVKGQNAKTGMNLMDYIDTNNKEFGDWHNQESFEKYFNSKSTG